MAVPIQVCKVIRRLPDYFHHLLFFGHAKCVRSKLQQSWSYLRNAKIQLYPRQKKNIHTAGQRFSIIYHLVLKWQF
jgi:hypothetical protein